MPSGVNWTVSSAALDPILDEAALIEVVDVHIFEADVAAVGVLQDLDDLADARALEAQRAADPDRMVEVGIGEAVIGRGEVGRHLAALQAERVEPRREVPAHAIGADEHDRADRIRPRPCGSLGVGVGRCGSGLGGRRATVAIIASVGSSPG